MLSARRGATVAFVGKTKKAVQQFDTPEEMYLSPTLPRTGNAVQGLWVHQGDVIRAYADKHTETADLALELPTGTGKTLPGLLIGEWVRRKGEGPVLYATPTTQLAKQVAKMAKREGVPVALLVGKHDDWDPAEEMAVETGEKIGLTTYSSVFNTRPYVPVPRLIIFDDAHAGEQFVGHKHGVDIRRTRDEAAYLSVLTALKPFLSGLQYQRLTGAPDPGSHHAVRLIVPAVDRDALTALDATLAKLGRPHRYDHAMIRAGFDSSLVYLSYSGIQIRPMIPSTSDNKVFAQAKQRIYLSATLGSGGELERAFGRTSIVRMPLKSKTAPRSGRRLFVFPDLVAGGDSLALTKQIVALTGKALVLSQDTVEGAKDAAALLAGAGVSVLGRDELESQGLQAFAKAQTGVLGLANRYDGMDLPDSVCRIVVLDGKPDAVGLQEKFLSERAEANAALSERIRTRIVQGAGRSTRGPNDFAVVIVRGTDLTKYFARPENIAALEPELQAEVLFGWENSRGFSADTIVQNVETFLEHDEDWRSGGEEKVAEFLDDANKLEPAAAEPLGKAAPLEVAAWQLAYAGDWVAASDKLQEAVSEVGAEATRGYRGLLLYIAGVWMHLGARDETQRGRARELVRGAGMAANRGTWLREMMPLPGATEVDLAPMDVVAVNEIVTRLRGKIKSGTLKGDLAEMQAALEQIEAKRYERGLTALGSFLGAAAAKPQGQARADSSWEWGTAIWLTIEAKSEQHDDGLLPVKDIRQANTQMDQLAADRNMDSPPANSPIVLLSDRLTVDPQHAPIASRNVYLSSPAIVKAIAADVAAVWADLLSTATGKLSEADQRKHVRATLTDNGCLPSQVIDRLTETRIRPGD
ncbi:DEAD/DEAH box helicase [Curtobacterium sp. MCLR17_044]|uniref:DEAD/DEAH box helicase n=1 Tax=Curtobacterium sp. MCLR17_044 TaxID=2175628 RepID=UPI0011B47E9D